MYVGLDINMHIDCYCSIYIGLLEVDPTLDKSTSHLTSTIPTLVAVARSRS